MCLPWYVMQRLALLDDITGQAVQFNDMLQRRMRMTMWLNLAMCALGCLWFSFVDRTFARGVTDETQTLF
jgi:hypothetical protein